MSRAGRRLVGLGVIALAQALTIATVGAADTERLQLPAGFSIEIYAEGVVNARQMALAGDGTLFVGTRRDGRVWMVRDEDADGRADSVRAIASDLRLPSGVALADGDLYVAALDTIYRYPDVLDQIDAGAEMPEAQIVTDALPDDTHHGWKHIEFGPDGDLWVPVGAPCNICDPGDPYASILKMDPLTGDYEIWARGIRNSVGFDFHPRSGDLWLSDNGRDMLGDDIPPEEINVAPVQGLHFGYPHIHAGDLRDPEFGDNHDPADYEPPALKMQAHSAPLGIAFYTGSAFPPAYRGALFIAQHGSWNRSSKVGYQVLVARLDGDTVIGAEPFVTGWLEGETSWGRPVDVLVHPDGSLLVSDDQGGRIWRIRHDAGR